MVTYLLHGMDNFKKPDNVSCHRSLKKYKVFF